MAEALPADPVAVVDRYSWVPRYNVGPELLEAMRLARSTIGAIETSGHNKFDDYVYSSMKDYSAAVEAGLAHNGLLVVIEKVIPRIYATGRDKLPSGCHATLLGHVYHVSGQSLPFEFTGEAFDRADKASYKATTGGRKYALSCLFNLKGGTDPESDETVSKAAAEETERNPYRDEQNRRGERRRRDRDQDRQRPAEAAEEARPQQRTPLSDIQAAKTAPALSSLLMTLVGKFPAKAHAAQWFEWGKAAKDRIDRSDWAEPQKAAAMAVLSGVKAQLAQAKEEAKAAEAPPRQLAVPPTEPAPAVGGTANSQPAPQSAPAASPPVPAHIDANVFAAPAFIELADYVEQHGASPDGMHAVLDHLCGAEQKELRQQQPQVFAALLDHASGIAEYHVHKNNWQPGDADLVAKRLAGLMDLESGSREVFGGN